MDNNHNHRSGVYFLLSRIFHKEMDLELMEELHSRGLVKEMREAGFELALPDQVSTKGIEALAVEYTRLFIGPGPHVSLYASVHSQKEGDQGRMWGDSTVMIKKYIEASGLEFTSEYEGIPDHLAVALEFLARLVIAEGEAREEGDEETAQNLCSLQRQFTEEYLLHWFPDFIHKLEHMNPHPFYRSFAEFSLQWLHSEMEYLEESLAS